MQGSTEIGLMSSACNS